MPAAGPYGRRCMAPVAGVWFDHASTNTMEPILATSHAFLQVMLSELRARSRCLYLGSSSLESLEALSGSYTHPYSLRLSQPLYFSIKVSFIRAKI